MDDEIKQDGAEPTPASDGSQSDAYVNKLQSIIERMNAITLHQCNREYDGSQRRFAMHPLTCGNDSRHGVLLPWFDGKKIRLVCPDCDYTQNNSAMF
jgi:hypothetical protein